MYQRHQKDLFLASAPSSPAPRSKRPTLSCPHPFTRPSPGDYHYRGGPDAEKHLNDPELIAKLQAATQGNNREMYRQFSILNTQFSKQIHLRGLLKFKTTAFVSVWH
jgi:glutamate synthase domain-containing protein 2